MTFAEIYAGLPAGWLTEGEARLLWDTARATTGAILEVGCYKGRSTCLLAALGRPVYAVDPFEGFDSDLCGDEVARLFLANVRARGLDNVVLFPQRIEDWRPQAVGLAYLDGHGQDEANNYRDTMNAIGKALACDPEAVAIHDCNDSGGGAHVKRAALELLGPWRERVERLAVWRVG